MEGLDNIWEQVLNIIRTKVAKPSFDSWFGQTRAIYIDQDTFVIEAVNTFIKGWLEDKYTIEVSEALYTVTGERLEVSFVAAGTETTSVHSTSSTTTLPIPTPIKKESKISERNQEVPFSMLNSKYTFEKFVVGTGNRFAHAASLAVAESPGSSYNPLFIYGGSGLGKTHLLQAIGHFVKESTPSAKVVYLSSEKFMNEFINSISENKAEDFRQRYRKVDVLLIDDIQFFEKKIQTQEEFFHTFNALYEDGKQIVISSDRSPNELQTLEDRLRSRFGWGLITDITAPDLETRIAILRNKAISEGLEFPDDVMMYIANSFESNIRELEGALVRTIAYSSMVNKDIDLELVTEALKNILPNRAKKSISILDIQKIVGNYYQIKLEDFKVKKRTQTIAFPRQIAMYLARELTGFSLPKIGEEFGGRDHTTILYAHEKISHLLESDVQLQQQIAHIQKSLQI